MALTANQFIIPNGPPAAGRQIMQSSGIAVTDVALKGTAVSSTNVILAREPDDQLPTAENVALQVTFGPAVGAPTDPVQVLADGTIQFNQNGTYFINYFLSFARTGGGAACEVVARALADGVQIGGSVGVTLDTDDQSSPYSTSTFFEVTTAPSLVVFQISRNTAGPNDGGLIAYNPSIGGWNSGSSASISIYQLQNG